MSDAVGRLRQLGDNAVEGEWLSHAGVVYRHGCDGASHDAHAHPCYVANTWLRVDTNEQRSQATQDARFIAAARNVWDALLDVAEAADHEHEPRRTADGEHVPCHVCAALDRLDKETP